ncbi:uncharacterized protein CMU_037960 [Cryptosporidium muris RN66]|uniref:GINS subunit domain-containing protein n=1 Tax=Cryptosporidium muris (strain RN66) TaxID=441375 RepID=B6A940_CRYMR|nr:uncharacterized protein CMU_037960 [Cryptosporidium muris RN66]EEA04731.1 hypothetical protein CMU_037960 [Cryptosporidium muris RN66]|eukprot:XP_002139080.1 hypothetical protein [Cryptosporidium muris RN66]
MNNSIHKNPSVDLLNEYKAAGIHQFALYKENQFNDISKININHIESLQYLKPFISNISNGSQYDVAALTHLLCLQQNKIRILALLLKRCNQLKSQRWNNGSKLSDTIKSRISNNERIFFENYDTLINEYNQSISVKLDIPDFDICSNIHCTSMNTQNILCQIRTSGKITRTYLCNSNKLEAYDIDVYFNSGSLSFFKDNEVDQLQRNSLILRLSPDI